MRKTALMIGVAIFTATPALAQDNNATAMPADNVAAEPTVTATNDVAIDNSATNDLLAAAPAPDTTTTPVDQGAVDTTYAPPPAKPRFPWGVLGLLGLAGLIPRKAR